MKYASEVGRIIRGALDGDKEKVRNYTRFLAEKLRADGDERGAIWILKLMNNPGSTVTVHSNGARSVDLAEVLSSDCGQAQLMAMREIARYLMRKAKS